MQLRGKLCDLYENDAIFDKFQCSFSGDASHMMTVRGRPPPPPFHVALPAICSRFQRRLGTSPPGS